MLERTSTTERYARGVIAALIAVAALVLAANAGPAKAAEREQSHEVSGYAPASSSDSGASIMSLRV